MHSLEKNLHYDRLFFKSLPNANRILETSAEKQQGESLRTKGRWESSSMYLIAACDPSTVKEGQVPSLLASILNLLRGNKDTCNY